MREKIVDSLGIYPGSKVWEIGPGLGGMSELVLRYTSDLTGFEIDPAYCQWLRETYGLKGMMLVKGDVIRTWQEHWNLGRPDKILGNLPFNAASAIIFAFIEAGCLAKRLVLVVQDELGHRITSPPSCKSYSSFSVLCQTNCRITDGGRLSPGSFYPSPRVNSRIIIMEPAKLHGEIHCPDTLNLIVRTLFHARRKTLANNLKMAEAHRNFPRIEFVKMAIMETGIGLDRRPETLPPDMWVAIANKAVSY